jgi:hypothetical protein
MFGKIIRTAGAWFVCIPKKTLFQFEGTRMNDWTHLKLLA